MWQQIMAQQQQQSPGCSRSRHKAAEAEAAALQQQMQQVYEQMMNSMPPGEDTQSVRTALGVLTAALWGRPPLECSA